MEKASIRIPSTASGYDVTIGTGLLTPLGPEARSRARSRRAALITDAHVAAHYGTAAVESLRGAGLAAESFVVPPGETSKTLDQAARLYDALLRFGLDRGSVVVALGGGVVSDLAGFVAATYMRGVPWIAVSTTLLGQVDASVGGKTGVDHPECKNLIGAFHQPSAVLADVGMLATLPDEEFRTGLAEVVKHAMIRDADLFDLLERQADTILRCNPAVLERVVARNVRIKAQVVMADERESGLRRILNYGHTIGHALESLALESGAPAMTHGRAVALGMVAEARLAERRGLVSREVVDRQARLLERFGLPVRLAAAPGFDRCITLMRHDKKAEGGRHRFVVPEAIGSVREIDDATDEEICSVIGSLAEG
jgi:3-dehydroquinate synthase